MVDELDTEWVDNFLHEESRYNRFYRSVPETVAIHFLYVDRSGCLCAMRSRSAELCSGGLLPYSAYASLFNEASSLQGKKYRHAHTLQYNTNLTPDEILHGCDSRGTGLSELQGLEDMVFGPTVGAFHDLNAAIFIFREKRSDDSSTRKRRVTFARRTIRKRI